MTATPLSAPDENEALLADCAAHASAAEVFAITGVSHTLRFRGGELDSARSAALGGRALRVQSAGHLGYATSTDLADRAGLVQRALAAAPFSPPADFPFAPTAMPPTVDCYDPAIAALTLSDLMTLGEEMLAPLKAYDPHLQIEITIEKTVDTVSILNTHGLRVHAPRTALSVLLDVTQASADDIFKIVRAARARDHAGVVPATLVAWTREMLQAGQQITTLASGTRAMPIVFTPLSALTLWLPMLFGFDGSYVQRGASPLAEKLGTQVFDPRLSITDDGQRPFARYTAPFDDEGVPTARTPLVENGVVTHFMHSLKTASEVGVAPTGNGFKGDVFTRDFRAQPSVGPTTWSIAPGTQPLSAILRDLDEALVVIDVVGGLDLASALTGDFSCTIGIGFLYRRGENTGRVKNVMLSGNIYTLLRDQLIALDDTCASTWRWLHTPSIVLDAVTITV